MLLTGSVGELKRNGPRPLPLAFSLLAHACVLTILAGERPIQLPKTKSAYEQKIQGREQKLVWYHFKEKLPEVKPTQAKRITGRCARK